MARIKVPGRSMDTVLDLPTPPVWFDEDRIKMYHELGAEVLAMRVLNTSDFVAFTILVDNIVVYNQAATIVAKEGAMAIGKAGQDVRHPATIAKNAAYSVIQPLLVQFGLTPSARATMGIGKEKSSTMDGFLPTNEKED